jgi:heme/copper-type cytochrome/quinol oxidase subunit 3
LEINDIIFFCIILFSLTVSTISSIWIQKKKGNKRLSRISSFCINSFILLISSATLYQTDAQMFHKEAGSMGIIAYLFSIPVLTLINFYILDFCRKFDLNITKLGYHFRLMKKISNRFYD